jgi:hypothetical protein
MERARAMRFSNFVRKLVAVNSLAVAAVVAFSAEAAQAKSRNFSEALLCSLRNYYWDDARQACADKQCQFFGKTYEPGDFITVSMQGGDKKHYYCDGFTGNMTEVEEKRVAPPAPAPGELDLKLYY